MATAKKILLSPAVALLMTGHDGIFSATVEVRAAKAGGKFTAEHLFRTCFISPTSPWADRPAFSQHVWLEDAGAFLTFVLVKTFISVR